MLDVHGEGPLGVRVLWEQHWDKPPADSVEYEWTSLAGDGFRRRASLGELITLEVPPCQIRYRFLWGEQPGVWDNEGLPWVRSL
jgi:hypothetical protein